MRLLVLLALASASPAWAQKARPVESLSQAQLADYKKLRRAYLDTFRILGKSKLCGFAFDAEPFFREVARRHGVKSEEVRISGISYKASAENLIVSPEVDPAPPAPMPCDVVLLMKDMRLPDLPASLRE